MHRTLLLALALSSVLLTACGSSSGGTTPPPGCTGANCTRTVTVTNVDAWWTAAGKTDVQDESLQFAVVHGTPEAPVRVAATQPTAGVATWTVTGVPEGAYWLESRSAPTAAPTYRYATANRVDVGTGRWGRADARLPTGPTPVTFHFTGMAPWTEGLDAIAYASAGAGILDSTFGDFSYQPDPWGVVTGDTAATGTESYDLQRIPLVDPAKGDTTWFVQLAAQVTAPGDRCTIAERFHASTTFGVSDGVSNSYDVPFQEPSAWLTVPVTIRQRTFRDHMAEVHPGALANSVQAQVVAYPLFAQGAIGSWRGGLPLLEYSTGTVPLDADVGPGDARVGRFLPAPWFLYRTASFVMVKPYQLPGATVLNFLTWMYATEPAEGASALVVPGITPPRSLRLGGSDATADLAGVGASPHLTWTSPSVVPAGASIAYAVKVYELSVSGTRTAVRLAAAFEDLPVTSLTFPAGLLSSGSAYFAEVSAYTTAPAPGAMYAARALTGIFRP